MLSNLGYVQVRLQSRLAELPDEILWNRLTPLKGLGAYVEEARNSRLQLWVSGLSGNSSLEEIDQQLKRRLFQTIEETAGWFSSPWRPAIRWLQALWYLGGRDPRDDPENKLPAEPLAALLQENPPGRLPALNAWYRQWLGLLPRAGQNERQQGLWRLLERHLQGFGQGPVRQAWRARAELGLATRRLFRRQTLEPAAAFAYLLLVALALERLRAELIERALLQRPGSPGVSP